VRSKVVLRELGLECRGVGMEWDWVSVVRVVVCPSDDMDGQYDVDFLEYGVY
jgi:hypothetical protein